ncbi:MAG: helix-turn-helix transcriptional regulator [Lachnospiraceae bacterium]|nr:helix-turn-helix transcriptional regulator [Lachnospiraceae bacterium]
MTIGKKILELRVQKELTQKQLSDMCGFSQSALNLWENDKRKPKIGSLHKIADVLHVSISDLVGDNYDDISREPLSLPDMADEVKLEDYVQQIWAECGFSSLNPPKTKNDRKKISEAELKYKLLERFEMLNLEGKGSAVSQLALLTKIPEYRIRKKTKKPPSQE